MTEIRHTLDDPYNYHGEYERLYTNCHKFNLFDAEAILGWNQGEDWIHVWCPASFSSGMKTGAYRGFAYNIRYKYWSEDSPKGSAKACVVEIQKLVGR